MSENGETVKNNHVYTCDKMLLELSDLSKIKKIYKLYRGRDYVFHCECYPIVYINKHVIYYKVPGSEGSLEKIEINRCYYDLYGWYNSRGKDIIDLTTYFEYASIYILKFNNNDVQDTMKTIIEKHDRQCMENKYKVSMVQYLRSIEDCQRAEQYKNEYRQSLIDGGYADIVEKVESVNNKN